MSDAKTRPTPADVTAFLDAKAEPARRAEADQLLALMRRATGYAPQMWGPSIVGFGQYHYRYESGREGDAPLVGFSPRKSDWSIYLVAGAEAPEHAALMQRLGKHKMGKACLSVKRLTDIDLSVLEELVRGSVAEIQRRYP
jgi:hypothetical protein